LRAQVEATGTNLPAFAAEWRVTGFVRQGRHEEASVERPGVMPRFVCEGDRLPGDVLVLDVNYEDRSVTLHSGQETATIRPEATMAAPPPPPKSVLQMWGAGASGSAPSRITTTTINVSKPTAIRDKSGNWNVVLPGGRSYDMKGYAERHGGIKGAIEHVRERLERETDPERIHYRKEQLKALKSMEKSER
jgi:hypothetical protein